MPLLLPIHISGEKTVIRNGIIIIFIDESGVKHYGEVSPLKCLDDISIEQCYQELIEVRENLLNSQIKLENFNLHIPYFGLIKLDYQYNPHVMFGIESVLLSIIIKKNLYKQFYLYISNNKIIVNGLYIITDDNEKKIFQQKELLESGFKTIKIKIGRLNLESEVTQINTLFDVFKGNINIRLDANRNLSFIDYSKYYKALKHLPIEYIEEPLNERDSHKIKDVLWNVAIDESMYSYINPYSIEISELPKNIGTIIIKPGVFSGISGIIKLFTNNNIGRFNIVFSSTFNTSITIFWLGFLASIFSPSIAHGLDTLKYFKEDIIVNPIKINNGTINFYFSHFLNKLVINNNIIKEI